MNEEMETKCEVRSYRRNRLSDGNDVKSSMTPIEGAIKRANNALGVLNEILQQLEERISPVLSSACPTECSDGSEKNPTEGESSVFSEIESVSNRIYAACSRVREIRDRVEL